jgi:hypothetical protein
MYGRIVVQGTMRLYLKYLASGNGVWARQLRLERTVIDEHLGAGME